MACKVSVIRQLHSFNNLIIPDYHPEKKWWYNRFFTRKKPLVLLQALAPADKDVWPAEAIVQARR